MQLLLNGNGPVEIALRDVVGKRFFQRVVEMFRAEKQVRGEYSKALADERQDGTNLFHKMVFFQTEDLHVPEAKAKSIVRACTRTLYKPLTPDFKSATDAVLCANGKLKIEDAKKAKDGKENEMSISPDELRKARKSYNCVSDQGTRLFHSRLAVMRLEAQVLMHEDGLPAKEAHEIVAKDIQESGIFTPKDSRGKPRPPEFQAKINYDKEYDLDLFRAESKGADPRALPSPPGPPLPKPPQPLLCRIEGRRSVHSRPFRAGPAPPEATPPPRGGGGGGGGGGGSAADEDGGGGEGSGLSSMRRKCSGRAPHLDESSSDTSSSASVDLSPSILHTKKRARHNQLMSHSSRPLAAGASRADGKAPISASVNSDDDADPFIVKCVVNRKTWPGKLPTFIQVAKVPLCQQPVWFANVFPLVFVC